MILKLYDIKNKFNEKKQRINLVLITHK
ncbi:uncharacterized protein METZ01_LOCUS253903 [marine metagenome]|uniref:Uncharacterized protein n=1 Tax=marine metagenome TaxID=408172 RepID=A0A382IP61_9ZZZZ